jgi:hypothetical protein
MMSSLLTRLAGSPSQVQVQTLIDQETATDVAAIAAAIGCTQG